MTEYFRKPKICNCLFPEDTILLKQENEYIFCSKCGSIIIKGSNGKINYTIKPNSNQEIDSPNPIDIIKSMKIKTKQNYPYLDNLSKIYESNKFYLINRKMILFHLLKIMKIFKFNKIVFYQSIFFMDYVFSHQLKKELSENEIIYYLIGYFLFSAKFNEIGIGAPPLENFVKIKKNNLLSKKEIAFYEIMCLKSINYNIYNYSSYDWINQLILVGIVFDCEIGHKNLIILDNEHKHSIINLINKFALKLLWSLTQKNRFLKFSPMQIAFSIIQIAREKILDPNLINQNLFNKLISLYGINFHDYKDCYEQIKLQIRNQNIQEEKNEEEEEKNNNDNMNIKGIKRYIKENNLISNFSKINNIFYLKKSSSCQSLLEFDKNNQKENFEKIKELDDKTKFSEIKNKFKDNTSLGDEIKIIEKNNIIPNIIRLNKIIFKKVNRLNLNRNKKHIKNNNSLPLIDSKNKLNFEPMKEKDEEKQIMNSKILPANGQSNSIFSFIKKNYINKKESNLVQNFSNQKIMNKTLYKINSRNQKNLFKMKIKNKTRKNNSIESTSIFKKGNLLKSLSSNNSKFEYSKINNNYELLDKFMEKNTNRNKRNINHNFPFKRNQIFDKLIKINSSKSLRY